MPPCGKALPVAIAPVGLGWPLLVVWPGVVLVVVAVDRARRNGRVPSNLASMPRSVHQLMDYSDTMPIARSGLLGRSSVPTRGAAAAHGGALA